ncbi:MAG TPA: RDD family protein [Phycisphaerae bacterium]|nr:RDD family protein [Phycisphaerae bacterium]
MRIVHPNRPHRRTRPAGVAVGVLLTTLIPAFGQSPDWKPARLWVSGTKTSAWVVASNTARSGVIGELQMWWAGPKAVAAGSMPAGTSFLQRVPCDPWGIAASADGLKILYSDGSIENFFPDRLPDLGASWKQESNAPPLAWVGDDSTPGLYAVVATSSLEPRKRAQPEKKTPVDPNDNGDNDLPSATSTFPTAEEIPPSKRTLILLRRGVWQRLAMPDSVDEVDQFWLAARNEHVYLFWQSEAGEIRYAEQFSAKWSKAQVAVSLEDVRCGWAGMSEKGPLFVAGVGPDIRSVRLHIFAADTSGNWSDTGTLREGSDYLTVDGVTTGVGAGGGKLGVARLGDRDQVEYAWGDAAGSPVLRFAPLSARVDAPASEPGLQSMLMPAIVLAFLTAVLMARRERIMRPASPPLGFVIAPVWKRAVATLIDLMPGLFAGSLAMTVMWDKLEIADDLGTLMEQMRSDPGVQQRMLPVNFFVILVYGLWCMVWELTTGTTLGKRILRCRVVAKDGTAPEGWRIVVRNVVRIVMVSMGETGLLITFLTMVLLTRNCQRLGDILADTIVVQPGPIAEIPVARPRDRNGEPPSEA